jgi:RNA polymerase sigma-70 factor, ECF subfamily
MSAAPPTDLELVRGLHSRDRKALARVYADYNAAIYNVCARILGDREEAKDVTQEVFLKAFASPPAATDDVRLRPWLFRVATNACLNLIRSRRTDSLAEPDAIAATPDPFEQARSVALIEGALGAMNERYRAALVLKDLHGVGGEELAEVLDISRPAADVLVHRAHAAFRRAFAGLAGEDAVAPANLAVALPALAVPAALRALPLTADSAGAPSLVPPAATGAGPAIGALAKIGAALSTKAAIVAAGAALAAGGGIAAVELTGQATTPAPASTPAPAMLTGAAPHGKLPTAGASHDDLPGHHTLGESQAGSHHGEGAGHHSGEHSAGHDASSGDHAGDGDHTASVSHEPAGDHSTSTSATTETHSSSTTGSHTSSDSGHDGSGSGDGGE